MQYPSICRILGRYLVSFSCLLLVPLAIAVLYEFALEPDLGHTVSATAAFLETIAVTLVMGGGLWALGKKASDDSLRRRECILLVVLIWFITAAIGALPFCLTGALSNPVDAYFEAMSGLTTTGATIIEAKSFDPQTGLEMQTTMQNPLQPHIHYTFYGTAAPLKNLKTGAVVANGLEALGRPLLFWRSFLAWVGGIGVVVLFVAILPALAIGGKFLYETEVAGPSKEGVTPRIKETAGFLWKLYVVLTAVLTGCLLLSDMSLGVFEALTLAFGTISTGGFYVRDACLLENLNGTTAVVVAVFMVVGATNFSLFFHGMKRRFYRLRDPELYVYLSLLTGVSTWMAVTLWLEKLPLSDSLAYGIVQTISAMTSTGFSFVDYDEWPMAAQLLIIVLMYVGGMSGSTSGGVKVIRYIVAWRTVAHKVAAFFRPEQVRVLKVGSKEIPEKTSLGVLGFFFLVGCFVVLGTYLLVLDNIDLLTSFGVISSTINNSGLYFGGIGCTASLGFLSDYSKVVATLWMVLGRLEFVALLVLFSPGFWCSR